jgi:predicted RND superfamily exporter protein
MAPLLWTKVGMARDLGLLGLLWMLSAFVVVIVATPALLSLLPSPGTAPHRDPLASLAGSAPGRSRPWVLATLMALLASGVLCATRLEVGDNVPGSSYIRADHPWNQCFHLLSKKFMGPFQLLVHARAREEGGLMDPEAMLSLAEFSGYLRDACGARDSIAFDMMIRMARLMLTDGNPKWQTLPDSREEIEGLARLVVEEGGVESFMDKTFTEATLSPFFPQEEAAQIDAYVSRMQGYIDAHPSGKVEFRLGGGLLAMTKLVNDGTRDVYWQSLIASFAVAFLLTALVTGSLSAGLIVTLPVAAAQSLLWCILAASGTPLSLPLASVAAFGVGSGSLFGFILVRKIADASGEPGRLGATLEGGWTAGAAQVLFGGVLAFAACLPWFFIGLKFQSTMVLVLGVLWILEALSALLFVPALAGWWPKPRRSVPVA